MTTPPPPPDQYCLVVVVVVFFWPQIAPFEVKYCYFIANELHIFRLIHSDISLNMDQCYISVLLLYLWYIVVYCILRSPQTVNPMHVL